MVVIVVVVVVWYRLGERLVRLKSRGLVGDINGRWFGDAIDASDGERSCFAIGEEEAYTGAGGERSRSDDDNSSLTLPFA